MESSFDSVFVRTRTLRVAGESADSPSLSCAALFDTVVDVVVVVVVGVTAATLNSFGSVKLVADVDADVAGLVLRLASAFGV